MIIFRIKSNTQFKLNFIYKDNLNTNVIDDDRYRNDTDALSDHKFSTLLGQ